MPPVLVEFSGCHYVGDGFWWARQWALPIDLFPGNQSTCAYRNMGNTRILRHIWCHSITRSRIAWPRDLSFGTMAAYTWVWRVHIGTCLSGLRNIDMPRYGDMWHGLTHSNLSDTRTRFPGSLKAVNAIAFQNKKWVGRGVCRSVREVLCPNGQANFYVCANRTKRVRSITSHRFLRATREDPFIKTEDRAFRAQRA